MSQSRFPVPDDFLMKLISVVLAIIIWVVTPTDSRDTEPGRNRWNPLQTVNKEQTRTFTDLPITVLTAAEDARGFVVHPSTVTVTVKSATEDMRQMSADEIEVYVNLTDVVEAEGLRKQIRVRLPASVQIEKLDPPAVEVKIVRQLPEGAGAQIKQP